MQDQIVQAKVDARKAKIGVSQAEAGRAAASVRARSRLHESPALREPDGSRALSAIRGSRSHARPRSRAWPRGAMALPARASLRAWRSARACNTARARRSPLPATVRPAIRRRVTRHPGLSASGLSAARLPATGRSAPVMATAHRPGYGAPPPGYGPPPGPCFGCLRGAARWRCRSGSLRRVRRRKSAQRPLLRRCGRQVTPG